MSNSYHGHTGLRLRRFRTKRRGPEIMIAPLIDIIFQLLIFFMLITRFLPPSVAIALPESGSGELDESPAAIVSIDQTGNVLLDDRIVTLDALTSILTGEKASGEIDIVRLRADKSTEWQLVVDVLNAIRASGIIGIAVEIETEGERQE